MRVIGLDTVLKSAQETHHQYKFIFNQQGIIFFPAVFEHRSQKAEGISYEDEYRGNALAAIVNDGRVEIRFHRGFERHRVKEIIHDILSLPDVASLSLRTFSYQGKPL